MLPFLVPPWVIVCVAGTEAVRGHASVCVCVKGSQVERRRERSVVAPAVFDSAVTKQNTGINGRRVNTVTEPIFCA